MKRRRWLKEWEPEHNEDKMNHPCHWEVGLPGLGEWRALE